MPTRAQERSDDRLTSDSMNDTSSELRQISRFSLRGLFFLLTACSIQAAAWIYGLPFGWLMSVAVLAMLVGASARGLSHANSARRAARIAIIVFGGVGFVHLSIARHPWTGSWLLGLTWDHVTDGSGWFTPYGASALGSYYTLLWTAAAVMAGCVVGVVVAIKNRMRRH